MAAEPTASFSSKDSDMETAIRTAKESFGDFIKAFLRPTKQQKNFLIKAVFVEGEKCEHVWMADLKILSAKVIRGVVGNETKLTSVQYMQPAEIEPSQITDWMYVENGYLIGGYTIQVIRSRMRQEERQTFDARVPYKFR